MRSRIRKPLTITFGLVLGFLAGCVKAPSGQDQDLPPILIEAVAARSGALPHETVVNGVVKADSQATIKPQIAAVVTEVLVRSGDAVKRGQILVLLDGQEQKDRLLQAEADQRVAEAATQEAEAMVDELGIRLQRQRKLANQNLISDQSLDSLEAQLAVLQASHRQAQARLEQAAAMVAERQTALGKTAVRSPITGRVGQSFVEVGERVDPSSALFVVGNLDRVRIEIPMTESLLGRASVGTRVLIELDQEDAIEAELSRISPFLADGSFTTIAEIDCDNSNGRLWPGMFRPVRILFGASDTVTLVPLSAIWEQGNDSHHGVWVVDDAAGLDAIASGGETEEAWELRWQAVEVLAESRGVAGVKGLDEGRWVAVVGQHLLDQLSRDLAGTADDAPKARVRTADWQALLALQGLQREDLLQGFLDKQQQIARLIGAEIPASEDEIQALLDRSSDPSPREQ